MTIEELIALLQKHPAHFTVQAVVVHNTDADDDTAEIEGVIHCSSCKIVSLRLDGMPS